MGNCQKPDMQDVLTVTRTFPSGPVTGLNLNCLIWNKNYVGLFDFESKQIRKTSLVVQNSVKRNDEFELLDSKSKAPPSSKDKLLFQINHDRKSACFTIRTLKNNNFQDSHIEKYLWLLIRSTSQKKYCMEEGDVLKLGRYILRIRELSYNSSRWCKSFQVCTKRTVYDSISKNSTVELEVQQKPQEQLTCRICLQPGLNENPLIFVCKCIGSTKYIHLKCLQTWLAKKLNPTESDNLITVKWKPLNCQLCNSKIPLKVYLDGNKYYTVDIPRPKMPYIWLEVCSKDSHTHQTYHFVSFQAKDKLLIGRKNTVDVKISEDISVSRQHAFFTIDRQTGSFFVEDNSSKFGTLLLLRKTLKLTSIRKGLSLQAGANVFIFDPIVRTVWEKQIREQKEKENELLITEEEGSEQSQHQQEQKDHPNQLPGESDNEDNQSDEMIGPAQS